MTGLSIRWSLLLVGLAQVTAAVADVSVTDAWVREAPPVMSMTAGYLTLHNDGSDEMTVTAVQCEPYAATELHQTTEEDGVARMQQMPHVHIGAGRSFAFAPGGSHLMLFDPSRPVRSGDHLACSVTLANGQEVKFDAEVRRGF